MMHQPTSARKHVWLDLIGVAAMLMIAVKVLLSVDRAVDITVADEARYLYQGVQLLEVGFPSPQWAPLYSLWYFLLDLLSPGRNNVDLYYLSFTLLTGVVPLMLYIYLRRVSVLPVIALMASLLFLISVSNLNIRPYPTKFASFIVILFFLLTTWMSRRWHYLMLLMLTVLLSFVRPEYAFSAVIALCVGGVLGLLKLRSEGRSALRPIAIQAILVGGLAFVLVAALGNPLAGSRNVTAFKQHVALTYTMNSDPETNPWGNENLIAEQLFGEFDSVPEAIGNNPQAFLQHVWTNVRVYPANLLSITLQPYLPPRILAQETANAVFVLVLALALTALVVSLYLNRRYRQSLPSQIESSQQARRLPALHDPVNTDQIRLVAAFLALITLPVMISSLLLHPRFHYLQVQGLLLVMLGALFVSNTIRLYRPPQQRTLLGAGAAMVGIALFALALVPNLARGWSVFSEPRAWARTDYRNTVRAIQDLGIATPVNFLAYGAAADYSFDVYLTPGLFRKVPSRLKQDDLISFFTKHDVNMIIWPDKILEDLSYRHDEQYIALLEEPASLGFEEFAVPGTRQQVRVFVKEGLVAQWPSYLAGETHPADNASPAPQASGSKQEADRLVERGDYDQAVAIYSDLLELDPDDRASHMALGVALTKMGMDKQAIDRYSSVIRRWPEFPWAYMRRAELLEKTGQTPAAVKDYRTATELAPDNADIRFAVAHAFVRAGAIEQAIAEFEVGLALDPARDAARATLERLRQQSTTD